MEPILDEQQAAIRESALRLCKDFAGPARLRALGGRSDGLAWQQIVQSGWPGLLVPEADGGLGMGLFELALMMDECGQQLLQAPFLDSCVANFALARAGGAAHSSEQAARPMAPILVDESDVYASGAKWPHATRAGDGWRMDGKLPVASGAGDAEVLLLPARDAEGGALLVAMPATAAGLRITPQANVDGSSADALDLDGVQLAEASVLAQGADASRLIEDIASLLRVGTSAELIGVASTALSMTLEHLRTRRQFGKPLASFQALQHQCVNCFLDIELNRSLLYRVSAAWDTGQAHPAMIAALKARASRSALASTRAALQLHGAMGYTEAHDIGLYYKRAVVLAARHGNENHQAARFSALTLGEEASQ